MAMAAKLSAVQVFALIRPRGGGFVYTDDDVAVMRHDIELGLSAGIIGFAVGALTADGEIDAERTRNFVRAANGAPVTFHRAFDVAGNLSRALEQLVDIGVTRVLTSGGAATALEGADSIARLVDQARGRIIVMAGGGVRENNVREIIARTGVSEVHARISAVIHPVSPAPGADRAVRLRKPLPEDENAWEELDEARMRALIDLAQR
jgi:copper homeostasis protein